MNKTQPQQLLETIIPRQNTPYTRLQSTIHELVELVDLLRQPYNNSRHHDLYLMATDKLNALDDAGLLR